MRDRDGFGNCRRSWEGVSKGGCEAMRWLGRWGKVGECVCFCFLFFGDLPSSVLL